MGILKKIVSLIKAALSKFWNALEAEPTDAEQQDVNNVVPVQDPTADAAPAEAEVSTPDAPAPTPDQAEQAPVVSAPDATDSTSPVQQ